MSTDEHGGRWVDIQRQWYSTEIVTCSACGMMIPRRYWLCEDRIYCEPQCIALEHRVDRLRLAASPEPARPRDEDTWSDQ